MWVLGTNPGSSARGPVNLRGRVVRKGLEGNSESSEKWCGCILAKNILSEQKAQLVLVSVKECQHPDTRTCQEWRQAARSNFFFHVFYLGCHFMSPILGVGLPVSDSLIKEINLLEESLEARIYLILDTVRLTTKIIHYTSKVWGTLGPYAELATCCVIFSPFTRAGLVAKSHISEMRSISLKCIVVIMNLL